MNILFDIFLLLLTVFVTVSVARKNTVRALIRLAAVIAAAAGIWIAPKLAPMVSQVFAPAVQNSAAADLAELANTPVFDSAEETLSKIDLEALQELQQERFAATVEGYGVTVGELLNAAEQENAAAAEAALLGEPLSNTLAQVCCSVLLSLALLFLVLGVLNAIIRRRVKAKQKVTVPSAIIGVLSGVIVGAFLVIPLFELFRPFSAGVLGAMQWNASCEKSAIYGLLQWCNPFV